MSRISAFVRSYAIAAYVVVTFAISWGGLLAVGGLRGMSSATWQSDPQLPSFIAAMLAGPAIAGLVLTAVVSGRTGLRGLFARVIRWRVAGQWYAFALLAAPIVFTAVHAALALISPAFLPGLVTTPDPVSLLVFGTLGALIVGMCEELGWTGFGVLAVRARHTAFATGLIVGVPWGAWHLLTNDFWIASTYARELPVAWFVTLNGLTLLAGQLPAYRVLMVWLYDRTDSVLLAMLMHASLSACTFILGPSSATGSALVAYGFALAASWWVVVAAGAAFTSWRPVRADRAERIACLPGDEFIPDPIGSLTHAITIGRAPQAIWPWLIQMGAGSRAGWYSYDSVDNGHQPSATQLVPELQHIAVGTVFPALPGVTEGFTVLALDPYRSLVLGWPVPAGAPLVTWAFVLDARAEASTRLIVRARGGRGYRFHGLPGWASLPIIRCVHYVMQRRQLLGIARRVESSIAVVQTQGRYEPRREHVA